MEGTGTVARLVPEDECERYDVERLLQRRTRGGNTEYLVKWLDYDDGHNTWEPTAHICAEALASFEAHRLRDNRARVVIPCARCGRSVPENLLGSALHASEKSQ